MKVKIGSDNDPVTYRLEYGTDPSDLSSTTPERSANPVPSNPGFYTDVQTISDLAPDTKYYVRIVAANQDGTSTSPTAEFSTIGRVVVTTGQPGPVTFRDRVGLLAFNASAVINSGGRGGLGLIQVSLYPDLRRADDRDGCSPPGPSEAGRIQDGDRSDHTFTDECTLAVPPASRTQEVTVYMRAFFRTASGDECTSETGTEPISPQCAGQTVSFQVPASTFAGSPPPAAQVRSAVLTALSPTGAAAKIGSILNKGFSAAKLNAPSAGSATIVWKRAPAGASGAASAVLAKGSKKVSKAGKTVVSVRLTARGKALLRQAKRKKATLRVRATGTFTPKGGKKVTQTKLVKLRN